MTIFNWPERIARYVRETGFPEAMGVASDGTLFGVWVIGNDYRNKTDYHGEYPASYLRRMRALFHDKNRALHLFSGMVDTTVSPGDTCDVREYLSPTYVDDAHVLSKVPLERYDIVYADPPYSGEDATKYGTPMVDRNKVMEALRRTAPGCLIVWLDQVLPMYSKDWFRVVGRIGIVRSTNHRFRCVTIFERTDLVYTPVKLKEQAA